MVLAVPCMSMDEIEQWSYCEHGLPNMPIHCTGLITSIILNFTIALICILPCLNSICWQDGPDWLMADNGLVDLVHRLDG